MEDLEDRQVSTSDALARIEALMQEKLVAEEARKESGLDPIGSAQRLHPTKHREKKALAAGARAKSAGETRRTGTNDRRASATV